MNILHALPPPLEALLSAPVAALGGVLVRATAEQPDGPAPELIGLVVISAGMTCDAARMARLVALRGIVAVGSGTDSIDVEAATARGIPVAHAPTPENIAGMAEATVMLMLAASFALPEALEQMNAAVPRRAESLVGKTVGLVGTGRIACAVARRLQGWDTRILMASGRPDATVPPGVTLADLPTLLAESDILSLHVALNPATLNLIGRAELAAMKPGAILINTARGSVVDEVALAEALQAGSLRGAALDVFAVEPLPPESPLWQAPRLLMTPHCVGHTENGRAALGQALVENVVRLLKGKAPLYPRNAPARLLGA